MRTRGLLALTVLPLLTALSATAENRIPWTMDESYQGPHNASFQKLRYEVPIIIRQTMIDLAVRLGLNFQEGFNAPLMIRFADGAPAGAENALAYVQLMSNGTEFKQQMVVNLGLYDQERFEFDKVFAHEMVHAMLNDALGGDASLTLPVWVHEGLAVYGANQGEQMLSSYVQRFGDAGEEAFLNGLEGPHGALDYAEDYLAIKYIHSRHGVNSLHGFARELINRRGDVAGAAEAACFESWDVFQKNARDFAAGEIKEIRRSQRRSIRANQEKPY